VKTELSLSCPGNPFFLSIYFPKNLHTQVDIFRNYESLYATPMKTAIFPPLFFMEDGFFGEAAPGFSSIR